MGIYGQCHERYCFVTLTFNLKVTGGLLKVRFWPFFHFLTQFSYTESQIILWLVYIIHIYVLCKHPESTDRQSTLPRVIFGLFGDIFTLNADYIAWKLLKMALEVEYMMDLDLNVCELNSKICIFYIISHVHNFFPIAWPILHQNFETYILALLNPILCIEKGSVCLSE